MSAPGPAFPEPAAASPVRPRPASAEGSGARTLAEEMPRVSGTALAAGGLSGFFGIGGGFLIVPGLLVSARMPTIDAVGSSLLAVAALYSVGDVLGGLAGLRAASALAPHQTAFTRLFAGVIFAVAASMLWRTAGTPWA